MMNLRASRREAASLAPRISIVYRAIDQLKPDPANPRLHSKKQIRQIANSIETFGFNVPVLVDAELNVIAGHGRLLACRELGWSEVPTLCLDHLTPAQARAFATRSTLASVRSVRGKLKRTDDELDLLTIVGRLSLEQPQVDLNRKRFVADVACGVARLI
jgi:hypothetical protein